MIVRNAEEVKRHINEDTDLKCEFTDLRCHLDCIEDAETIEDSRANVAEAVKSLRSMLNIMQELLTSIDSQ